MSLVRGARKVTSTAQIARLIDVQRLELMLQPEEQSNPNANFSRRRRQDENEHHLAIRLPPARAGHDEGQSGGVQHHFHEEQYEEDVTPKENPGDAEAEQNRRKDDSVLRWDFGPGSLRSSRSVRRLSAKMVGTDQAGEQQDRGQLDSQQVWAIERQTHLLRADGRPPQRKTGSRQEDIDQLTDQHQGQDDWPGPRPRLEPDALLALRSGAEIEDHHHEDEEHHDGSGVDDDLERSYQRCSQAEEDDRHREQRQDRVEKGVDGVRLQDPQKRG